MKLYDAICGNETFRANFSDIINDLIADQKSGPQRLRQDAWKSNSEVEHALRILANLAEKGNNAILNQMKNASTSLIIDEKTRALIVQIFPSDRWSKEFGCATYDLLLAIPELSKIIAVSTRDMDVSLEPMVPRLSKVSLQNVHLYGFFNRAHAVKGRRIYASPEEKNVFPKIPDDFKMFMRTCQDIQTIGKGMALNYFTPFETLDGLNLGFFFTLIGKVTNSTWISSPDGIGSRLNQVGLTLTDKTGSLDFRISLDVFAESLENPAQPRKINISDPLDLSSCNEIVFIIGAWILGKMFPEILFFSLTDNNLDLETWQMVSFLNSHRKIPQNNNQKFFDKNHAEVAQRKTNCVFSTDRWYYYKEETWPSGMFSAIEQNGFNYRIELSEALKYTSYIEYKVWSKNISRFFAVNPHLIALYRSETPVELFKKMHAIQDKENAAASKYQIVLQERAPMTSFYTQKRLDILPIASSLSRLGYTVWDLFSPEWNNGGYTLERRWLHLSHKEEYNIPGQKSSVNELLSALTFILSMRMEVNIPVAALKQLTTERK
jgi:hypothetical protein